MHSPRVYFNNIGPICTDSVLHGNGLSVLLLLTRAAKSSAAQIRAEKHAPWKAGFSDQYTTQTVKLRSTKIGIPSIVENPPKIP